MNIRAPDHFVKLQLHADFFEAARGNEVSQSREIGLTPDRRDEDRVCAAFEIVARYYVASVSPIGTIHDDEFDLVTVGAQPFEVRPVIAFGFARGRAFHIEDKFRALVNIFRRDITARFDQDFVARITETCDERQGFALRERFAACDFDELAVYCAHLRKHVIN